MPAIEEQSGRTCHLLDNASAFAVEEFFATGADLHGEGLRLTFRIPRGGGRCDGDHCVGARCVGYSSGGRSRRLVAVIHWNSTSILLTALTYIREEIHVRWIRGCRSGGDTNNDITTAQGIVTVIPRWRSWSSGHGIGSWCCGHGGSGCRRGRCRCGGRPTLDAHIYNALMLATAFAHARVEERFLLLGQCGNARLGAAEAKSIPLECCGIKIQLVQRCARKGGSSDGGFHGFRFCGSGRGGDGRGRRGS